MTQDKYQNFSPDSDFDDDEDDYDDDDDDDDLDQADAADAGFDLNALVFAWQDTHPDNNYYFDTNSGGIKMVNRNLLELRDLTDEIERHKYRYLYLPKPDPKQLREDLRDFQRDIDNAKIKNILDMAFESPHPLEAFKKILSENPEKIKELEAFRHGRALIRIRQWMEANSLRDRWEI
ncbi:MAG: hypothetical protein J0H83_08625 [Candidatus Melainabacteria bacterium]|jgi:hypothetical protein|nr:hypothetical protein [Candidatus Melainabacteria bacterium]